MIDLISVNQSNYLNLATAFYSDCQARGLAPLTAQQYQSVAYEYMNETNPNFSMSAEYLDIKPSLVDFVNHCRNQNLSYSATKTKFTALNNYFTFLMDEGAININPVLQFRSRYVRTYKSPDTRDIIELTTQDIETLLKVANNPLFEAVIILSALTGLRRAELTALNIENIDFENRLIFVNPHPKRTNLRIPFSEDVFYYLDRYLKIRTE